MRYAIIVQSGNAVISDGKNTQFHTEQQGHAVYTGFNWVTECEEFIIKNLQGRHCEISQAIDKKT